MPNARHNYALISASGKQGLTNQSRGEEVAGTKDVKEAGPADSNVIYLRNSEKASSPP